MKPLVLVTGPPATRSGYGAHTRDLIHSLIEMDRYDIKINSMRWGNCPMNALNDQNPKDKLIIDRLMKSNNLDRQPEIHIQVSIPTEFNPIGKYNIGITAGMENTVPRAEWVDGLNRMNLNIVPSSFVKTTFEKVQYDKIDEQTKQPVGQLKMVRPMEVLFEGADLNIYKKTSEFSPQLVDEMNKIKENFLFLYTGHWLQGGLGKDRKDTGMLVKTFLETFKNKKNPPALLMKTSGATFSILDRNLILEKINEIKKTISSKSLPNIYVLHGDLEDEEMNEMYNHPKVKAHVTFTHGEGFGRPLLEACFSEKPIIAPNWSGHVDFLNKANSVLLPGTLVDVDKSAIPKDMLQLGAKWFGVNYQYAGQMLLKVFKDNKKLTLNAKKMAIINKSKFSLDNMTKEFEKILDKHLPNFVEPPKAVDLKLPKLKKIGDAAPPTIKLPKLKKV
jgi:glycosyltransferase involved in cell wall biosynthesis|tara:strand:- start:928 stop:2265 length:1338 start_codon:yes stop_codon:yes gene_type:complete